MITRGRVTWDDGSPVVGYRVVLWDSDSDPDDRVKVTTTNGTGNYHMQHKKRQDPVYYGKKRRKGDFYIKVRKPLSGGGFKTVYQSPVYQDYKPPELVINVVLNRVLVEYGANTVYGTVTGRWPDGTVRPLPGLRVKAVDRDAIGWDTLGGQPLTNANGEYVITFSTEDYSSWWEFEEGLPDIQVFVQKRHRGAWRRVWESTKYEEASLPLHVNLELPVVYVTGTVNSYRSCEDGNLIDRPVTDLKAVAYDVSPQRQKRFLGEAVVDQKSHGFRIEIMGSRDNPPSNGNDIVVRLEDRATEVVAWESQTFQNQINPTVLDVNSGDGIDAVVECEDPEDLPAAGDAGTIVHLENDAGEERWIFVDDQNRGSLAPGASTTVHVPCGHIAKIQAKDDPFGVFNAVTFEVFIRGACLADPWNAYYEIRY